MPTQKFDPRSEENINTLLPDAQEQARIFLAHALAAGLNARIIGGTRTYEEQDALYALGRTKPGKIVTNARGGYSNHNFGIAWDIGIFDGKDYVADGPGYDHAGSVGRDLGLEWGGDWNRIVDKPHFQCATGLTLAQLRQLHTAGKPVPIKPLNLPNEVRIFLNGAREDIPALILNERVWVGARAFAELCCAEVTKAGGTPFTITMTCDSREQAMPGLIQDGVGYVKFADANGLSKYGYVFDSVKRRLDLTK